MNIYHRILRTWFCELQCIITDIFLGEKKRIRSKSAHAPEVLATMSFNSQSFKFLIGTPKGKKDNYTRER